MSESILRSLIPKIPGWLSADRAVEMYRLVREHRPAIAVEIGVFGGRSLIANAVGLKDNCYGKIYGIDPWKNSDCLEGQHHERDSAWWSRVDLHDIHRQCMEYLWRFELDDYVTIIRSTSQKCVKIIPNGIGMLYIDGNHSELTSCRDVELYVPKVNIGGYIWMDDCDWPTTKKAQALMDQRAELVQDSGSYRLYRKI